MAPTFPSWGLLAVVTALALQLSTERKTCEIWSSAGAVVERGSSFRIFCTFKSMCTQLVYIDSTRHDSISLNSTTLYIDVVNITRNAPHSCQCESGSQADREPCGIDIFAGYPPDRPVSLTCELHVTDAVVVCSWNSGTETYLPTTFSLRVMSGNHSVKGTMSSSRLSSSSANVSVADLSYPAPSSSIQTISVKVYAHNKLGTAESDTSNFTLRDIMKPSPPALLLVECSSRSCNITWHHSQKTYLEVQYSDVLDSLWQTSSSGLPFVHSLEPSRQYYFRARARLSSGLWSNWSTEVSNRTQEEVPDMELDVWFSRATSQLNTLTVYWKSVSEAKGRVLGYRVRINDSHSGKHTTKTVSANTTRLSVQSCGTCLVTVSAYNAIGSSPQARVPTIVKTDQPPQDLHAIGSNDSVSLYWRNADPTLLSTGYLVEWYPQGQQFEKLQWMRLSSANSQAVIREIEPYECYDGAVYVFYESSMGNASFAGVNTLVSVPTDAPSVTEQVRGDAVTLTWTQIPRGERGGCVRNYTVYIENKKDSKNKHVYHVPGSEHQYTVDHLPSATYSVWMTAWTDQGEGPRGSSVKFIIQLDSNILPAVIITVLVIVVVVGLIKLAGSQRLKTIHCLLQDVPDPSNSKWAKAVTDNKGKMDLDMYPSDSSSEEEEEHVVKFFEQAKVNDENVSHKGTADVASLHGPEWDSGTAPQTPYIKSLSHDSDSSHYTHSSQDTGTTAGYISLQAGESGVEGAEREEEEGCIEFSPFHGFDEPLMFEGMLTLNSVKIDCRNLWENDL